MTRTRIPVDIFTPAHSRRKARALKRSKHNAARQVEHGRADRIPNKRG